MEDHVYLYLPLLVAIAVSLLDRATFRSEAGRHGRHLLAMVFDFATIWKLASTSFLSGTALWTIGPLDDRMAPMLRLLGLSQESLDTARPQVVDVERASFDLELSGYSSAALVVLSLSTIAIEAATPSPMRRPTPADLRGCGHHCW